MDQNISIDNLLGSLDASAAPTTADVTAADGAATVRGKGKGKNILLDTGKEIFADFSADQKAALGENSDNFIFVSLLCADTLPHKSPTKDQTGPQYSQVVGIKIETKIDVDIPEIPFVKPPYDTRKSEFPSNFAALPKTHYKAGDTMVLTRMQALYLFSMPEYKVNGYIAAKHPTSGQLVSKGVQLTPKVSADFAQGGLPTPAFKYTQVIAESGISIKAKMISVDERTADGSAVVKPEYQPKFADVTQSRKGGKDSSGISKSDVPSSVFSSLGVADAIKKLIGGQA